MYISVQKKGDIIFTAGWAVMLFIFFITLGNEFSLKTIGEGTLETFTAESWKTILFSVFSGLISWYFLRRPYVNQKYSELSEEEKLSKLFPNLEDPEEALSELRAATRGE